MADVSPPIGIDHAFILTWGFEFISYTLDTALWGMAMVSTIVHAVLLVLQYFRKFAQSDPISVKVIVGILGAVTTNHTILVMQNFKTFALPYGNLEGENVILYDANVSHVVLGGNITASASPKFRLKTALFIFTPAEFGFVSFDDLQKAALLMCMAQVTKHDWRYPGAAGIGDESNSSVAQTVEVTDSVLDKMTIYALNRGAGQDVGTYTRISLWALLQLIFFLAMPGTFVFMMFILPSCHLYVISVCSMLISRESLRAELTPTNGIVSSFPMLTFESASGNNAASHRQSEGMHVAESIVKWVDDIPDDFNGRGSPTADNQKITLGYLYYFGRLKPLTEGSGRG
ncbi:hypothetical protein B0H13DRAFT_1936639 [Mycena leptocephala]|nr:hypothetical protein B0H13DRAFT_1936639 [Mycena leptocephala]